MYQQRDEKIESKQQAELFKLFIFFDRNIYIKRYHTYNMAHYKKKYIYSVYIDRISFPTYAKN